MMSLDNALWLFGVLVEAADVGLLAYRRVWRTLPVFCLYCAWDLFSGISAYAVLRLFPSHYLSAYLAETVVDSALEFLVLVELAWSVLRPYRASLPRGAFAAVAGLVGVLGAAIWPFAVIPGFGNLPPQWHLLMHMQQTASILRVLLFLVLAGSSQLLAIGWRSRELQVVSGLGFYSLVSLVVAALHTHQTKGTEYNHMIQVVVVSYLCSLVYWVYCFSQKDVERKEFSPQMQRVLLAVAGGARSARIALEDSTQENRRKR